MTRRELEVTDREEILHILDTAKVVHLGLVDDGMPYVLPMNYGYVMDEDGKLSIYLHSANNGYKLDVIRKNPAACFEMDCDVAPFEGKVACQYGITYYSLIGRGKAVIVEDAEEKCRAMSLLMQAQTGKAFEFNERLVMVCTVIRIDVDTYTAKHRPLPCDALPAEPKADGTMPHVMSF